MRSFVYTLNLVLNISWQADHFNAALGALATWLTIAVPMVTAVAGSGHIGGNDSLGGHDESEAPLLHGLDGVDRYGLVCCGLNDDKCTVPPTSL